MPATARRTLSLLALGALGVAARLSSAQTCPIYTTSFDSFTGPPDFANGEFSVSWCLNGASVTASNFCPTGSALKLDSSTDDPVFLVRVGNAECASVSVTFTYAQFAATGTTLKASLTDATSVACAGSTTTTLGTLSTTGGVCTQVTLTALVQGSQGILFRFDHGNTGATAITIDDLTVSVTGCCDETHTCCEVGPAGCADDAVAACVCKTDAYCCETAWDAICIEEVDSFGCGSCNGEPPVECLTSFATNFGTSYSTTPICTLFPDLFETCEGSPPTLTISGACASSGDPGLRFGTGFPYSAAITRCLDLSAMPAPSLRFRWTRNAGTLGPRIDYKVADGDWFVAWQPTTGQGVGACVETIVDLAPLAGETDVRFRLISGSSVANGAVFDDIQLEPGAEPHDCCAQGGPGCNVEAIEACACAVDDYCCTTAWDDLCVVVATALCDAGCPGVLFCGAPEAGECFAAHAAPYCNDEACCASVCDFDAFCCTNEWDALCAEEASLACVPPLVGDIDGDGRVDGADISAILSAWGLAGAAAGAADLDGNGIVDGGDLSIVLAAWTG